MTGLANLILAAVAFVGTHFLMSHPLRSPLIGRLGENGFRGLYVVVSLATFGWMAWAAWTMPVQPPAHVAGNVTWAVASLAMLFGSILFMGSMKGNPALPGANPSIPDRPRGVFAITRHPMMWGFALWALVHMAVWPTPQVVVVATAILVLALGGAAGQDAKKAKVQPGWTEWAAKTSFLPFARGFAGTWPGTRAVLIGTLFWIAATWGHGPLGAPVAVGVWRWIGG